MTKTNDKEEKAIEAIARLFYKIITPTQEYYENNPYEILSDEVKDKYRKLAELFLALPEVKEYFKEI